MATGSPFAPVNYGGLTIPIAQCNNVYIFPAIGLGVVASGAHRVTDAMMLAAEIAIAVGLEAQREGLAPKTTEEELRQRVARNQWTPAYAS